MPPEVDDDIDEKAAAVADLKAQADDLEADAKHAREVADAAAADHSAAVEKAEMEKLNPTKHVFVEQGRGFQAVEAPAGFESDADGHCRSRALSLSGVNVEHVSEKTVIDAKGVSHVLWVYRRM